MVFVVLFYVSTILTVVGSSTAGEFNILHSPESLEFLASSNTLTLESLLKEIFSAALGLSVDENADWNGMFITNPFNTPEALVQVCVDGVPSLSRTVGFTYPLTVDDYDPDTYEAVKYRIKQSLFSGNNKIVDVKLHDPNELKTQDFVEVFGEINVTKYAGYTLHYLKYAVDADYMFLIELQTLKGVIEKVWSGLIVPDNMIDFYNFRFRGLLDLSEYHGPNSPQIMEAKNMLDEVLQQLSEAFVKAYDGSVLVAVIVIDVAHPHRVIRSNEENLLTKKSNMPHTTSFDEGETASTPEEESSTRVRRPSIHYTLNTLPTTTDPTVTESGDTIVTTTPESTEADTRRSYRAGTIRPRIADLRTLAERQANNNYDADFTAIFNILLWFGVIFVVVLIALVYVMMDMDPGRDSVIYRTTNIRMKKDL